jgi:hypothetical protein
MMNPEKVKNVKTVMIHPTLESESRVQLLVGGRPLPPVVRVERESSVDTESDDGASLRAIPSPSLHEASTSIATRY